jgi:uncharacterized UPF0146 family protein
VRVQVAVQPLATTVVVSVKEPEAPAVTVIDVPVDDPTMVPLPEMIVEYVAPAKPLVMVKMFPVDPVQTEAGPLIVQVGSGFTVTVFVQVAEQPLAVTVVVSVKEPAAPAVTLIEEPVVEPMIVPLPEMTVEKVAPATLLVRLKMVPVAPVHRASGPVIVQVGPGFTVTVLVQVAEQPLAVTVVVSVKEPAAPAVTLIEEPVVEPTIVPLPEMTVEKVAPATLLVRLKTLPVKPAQTASGPVIEQVGSGLTVTVLVQVLEQPLAVVVVVRVNEPEAPAVTVIVGPVEGPTMVPFPAITVEKVEPATSLVIVKTLPVEPVQTAVGPAIVQVGTGWQVMNAVSESTEEIDPGGGRQAFVSVPLTLAIFDTWPKQFWGAVIWNVMVRHWSASRLKVGKVKVVVPVGAPIPVTVPFT